MINHVFCGEMCAVKDRAVVSLPCPVTGATRGVYHSWPGG